MVSPVRIALNLLSSFLGRLHYQFPFASLLGSLSTHVCMMTFECYLRRSIDFYFLILFMFKLVVVLSSLVGLLFVWFSFLVFGLF